LLTFPENRVFAFCCQHPRWRMSVLLDFTGPTTGSLKSPGTTCTTSYRKSYLGLTPKCKNAIFCQSKQFRAKVSIDELLLVWSSIDTIALNCLVLEKIGFLHFGIKIQFKGLLTASLKSLCTTSYRSSTETTALNCLVFEKIAFFAFWRQTE